MRNYAPQKQDAIVSTWAGSRHRDLLSQLLSRREEKDLADYSLYYDNLINKV